MGHPGIVKSPRRGTAVITTFVLLHLLSTLSPVSCVECYVCVDAASNEECSQDIHLIDCKTRSTAATELDTCQTKVSYNENGYSLTKRCVRGPCNLSGDQTSALGLQCDRSKSNWSCESCCTEDGCNKDGAPVQKSHVIVVALLSLIAVAGAYL